MRRLTPDRLIIAFLTLLAVVVLAPAATFAQSAAPAAPPTPWWQRVTFFGDMRVRQDNLYVTDAASRHQGRIRLRFGARAPINDDLSFTIRFSTGDPKAPATPNQTLGEFLSRKPFYMDQVALVYAPRWAPALTVGAGKYAYPVLRTQLVWDDDLNWEGAFERVTIPAGAARLTLTAAQSPLTEAPGGPDAVLFAQQGLLVTRVGGHEIQAGVSGYVFKEVDAVARALASGDLKSHNSNALRLDETGAVVGFESGFRLIDAIGQVTLATGRPAYPLSVIVDWVVNTRAPSDRNKGVWVEAYYGRVAAPRTYRVGYRFMRIEREAALTAYNHSELAGSNMLGNGVSFAYQPLPKLTLEVIGLFSRAIDVAPGRPNPRVMRLQLDAKATF